jgi:hypothetical protein
VLTREDYGIVMDAERPLAERKAAPSRNLTSAFLHSQDPELP